MRAHHIVVMDNTLAYCHQYLYRIYPILGQHDSCPTKQSQFVFDTRRNIITNSPIPAKFRSILWIIPRNSMIIRTWYPYFQFVLKHCIFKMNQSIIENILFYCAISFEKTFDGVTVLLNYTISCFIIQM